MPIPRSAILAYCNELDLDEDETEELIYFIRRMDDLHLERLARKMKEKS